jgi:hypothetical protein
MVKGELIVFLSVYATHFEVKKYQGVWLNETVKTEILWFFVVGLFNEFALF